MFTCIIIYLSINVFFFLKKANYYSTATFQLLVVGCWYLHSPKSKSTLLIRIDSPPFHCWPLTRCIKSIWDVVDPTNCSCEIEVGTDKVKVNSLTTISNLYLHYTYHFHEISFWSNFFRHRLIDQLQRLYFHRLIDTTIRYHSIQNSRSRERNYYDKWMGKKFKWNGTHNL